MLGSGGHCRVIIDAILSGKRFEIAGLTDVNKRKGEIIFGMPVLGNDSVLGSCFRKGIKNCFIAVGGIGNPDLRISLFNKVKKIGFKLPNVIHPCSVVSESSKLGEGNYIGPGAIINAGVRIGSNCIINTGAIIEHDCRIADFAHIASGAALSGGVSIKRCSHIGTGASIIQSVKVGKNCIIGAGSVVLKDVADNAIAYGNPLVKVRNNVR